MQIGGVEIPIKELLAQRRRLEGTINWQTIRWCLWTKSCGAELEDAIMSAGDNLHALRGKTWLAEYKGCKGALLRDRSSTTSQLMVPSNRRRCAKSSFDRNLHTAHLHFGLQSLGAAPVRSVQKLAPHPLPVDLNIAHGAGSLKCGRREIRSLTCIHSSRFQRTGQTFDGMISPLRAGQENPYRALRDAATTHAGIEVHFDEPQVLVGVHACSFKAFPIPCCCASGSNSMTSCLT